MAVHMLLLAGLIWAGCRKDGAPADQPTEPGAPPPDPAGPAASEAPTPLGAKASKASEGTGADQLLPPKNPDEACAQVIVVAWKGAEHAAEPVTRDRQGAQVRAAELLAKAKADPDFAALAKANSDASSSGPRGGNIGTYTRENWPAVYQPIREAIFRLKVNEVAAQPLQTPFGYVLARRCAVERARARHILVRYKGAEKAGDDITRSRKEAEKLARHLQVQAAAPGADFSALAREHSEDSSAQRGGDIGSPARGTLAPAFEQALFGLKPGQVSAVVETSFGFHIIQRPAGE